MVFECSQCGSCCMYLGDYIVIEREIGPFRFACCSVSTGTEFTAVVEPDKRHLFAGREWIGEQPHACRFLRPAGPGRVVCTIHGTSPPQCRAYRCTVMRVSLRSRPIGRVTGTLALHSDDPGLRTVWEDEILPIREHDDAERRIAVILSSRGYEVA